MMTGGADALRCMIARHLTRAFTATNCMYVRKHRTCCANMMCWYELGDVGEVGVLFMRQVLQCSYTVLTPSITPMKPSDLSRNVRMFKKTYQKKTTNLKMVDLANNESC